MELGRFIVEGKEHVWARYYMWGGVWTKKYMLVFGGTEYAITATCLNEKLLLEMEKGWDAIANSFRISLISPLDLSRIMQKILNLLA